MRVELIKQDGELKREAYFFQIFELTIILDYYYKQERESKRKRNWNTTEYYSRIDKRDSSIKNEDDVPIPDEIIFQAIEKVKSEVKHLKWSEYKR